MAWIKIPPENHPVFRAAIPPGVATKLMFGAVAGFVNDNMFAGLFARSLFVKLSATDYKEALELEGAVPFDPMGNGRVSKDTLLLPETVMADPPELRRWLQRAYDYTATLPPKHKAKKPTFKEELEDLVGKDDARQITMRLDRAAKRKSSAKKKSAAKKKPTAKLKVRKGTARRR